MRSSLMRGAAAAAGFALLLVGCSSSTPSPAASTAAPSAPGDAKVALTVATFNEFGYEDLFAEYTKAHPNVTITPKKAATSNEARLGADAAPEAARRATAAVVGLDDALEPGSVAGG